MRNVPFITAYQVDPRSLCLKPLTELMHRPRWWDNSKMMRQIMVKQKWWKVKPDINGRLPVNNVVLLGSKGSSHSCIYSLLPTCPPPRRVLIPQRGRLSEPERDGDGGGLLMWRSAAAIATWGLLSFNQTKTWWRMCTARGNCRGFRGRGVQGRCGQERSKATGRGGAGWKHLNPHLPLFPSLQHDNKKKGLPAAPVYHLSWGDRTELGWV